MSPEGPSDGKAAACPQGRAVDTCGRVPGRTEPGLLPVTLCPSPLPMQAPGPASPGGPLDSSPWRLGGSPSGPSPGAGTDPATPERSQPQADVPAEAVGLGKGPQAGAGA